MSQISTTLINIKGVAYTTTVQL